MNNLKSVVYASFTGALMILTGNGAYAQGSNTILQRLTISYNKVLRLPGQPTENLFLDFKGGVSAIIFGYSGPSPILELSGNTGRLKCGDCVASFGPYIDYDLNGGKLTGCGLSSFAVLKLGNSSLTAPVYFTNNLKGKHGLSIPNWRLTMPFGSKARLGIGGAVFASEDKKPTYLVGPTANFKLGQTGLMVRFAEYLSGPLKGQHQLRLDLAIPIK